MLVPGLLGKRDEYGQRYCGGKPMFIARGMYDWRSSSNLAELNAVLQKHLLIRRLKKNVLQDLPAKLRQRVPIEVDYECVGVSALMLSQVCQVWEVDYDCIGVEYADESIKLVMRGVIVEAQARVVLREIAEIRNTIACVCWSP